MAICRTCDGHRATNGFKRGGIAKTERICRNCIGILELDIRALYKFYFTGVKVYNN